jgi:hypothetical protein
MTMAGTDDSEWKADRTWFEPTSNVMRELEAAKEARLPDGTHVRFSLDSKRHIRRAVQEFLVRCGPIPGNRLADMLACEHVSATILDECLERNYI